MDGDGGGSGRRPLESLYQLQFDKKSSKEFAKLIWSIKTKVEKCWCKRGRKNI